MRTHAIRHPLPHTADYQELLEKSLEVGAKVVGILAYIGLIILAFWAVIGTYGTTYGY